MRKAWCCALAVASAALSSLAGAAPVPGCEPSDTLLQCRLAYDERESANRSYRSAITGTYRRFAGLETGLNALSTVSAVQNMAPAISLSGLGQATGQGDGNRSSGLAGAVNMGLPGVGDRLRIGSDTVDKPRLDPAVQQALKDAGLEDRIDDLLGALQNVDDHSWEATVTFDLGGNWSRSLDKYIGRYQSLALQALQGERVRKARKAKLDALALIQKLKQDENIFTLTENTKFNEIEVPPREGEATSDYEARRDLLREQIRQQWIDYARQSADYGGALEAAMEDSYLDRFHELVGNQKQMHVTYRELVRDPLLGADASTWKATFELAGSNFSSFEASSSCARSRHWKAGTEAAGEKCLADYRKFIEGQSASIRRGLRGTLSLEYTKIDDLAVSLPADNFRFDLPGAKLYAAQGALGWSFTLPGGKPSGTRLDLSGRYNRFDHETVRSDFWVATLAISQKVAGVTIPFTLMYRSKAEVETSVAGNDLVAGIGISYNLFEIPAATTALKVPPLAP